MRGSPHLIFTQYLTRVRCSQHEQSTDCMIREQQEVVF
jgi:hypothetical protein